MTSPARSLLRLALLLLCFTSMLSASSSSSSTDTERKLRARRHPKSRQRGANTECVMGYRQRIEHHCRYPSTEQPCFQQSESEWTKAVEEAAKQCCQTGLCSVEDFEGLCCRTPECLEKCYGPAFLQRFRNRFRYFDILTRPHPHSGGRSGREAGDLEAVESEEAAEQLLAAEAETQAQAMALARRIAKEVAELAKEMEEGEGAEANDRQHR